MNDHRTDVVMKELLLEQLAPVVDAIDEIVEHGQSPERNSALVSACIPFSDAGFDGVEARAKRSGEAVDTARALLKMGKR